MTKRKATKRTVTRLTAEFCEKARVGFTASGGTCRVLAGEAARHFGLPFVAALRAVEKAAVGCPGFFVGAAFSSEFPGDARGFGRFLARRLGGEVPQKPRPRATEEADLGWGFRLFGVTPEEKAAIEAAAFAAECDAHADALFGPLGDSAEREKNRLVREAVERGAERLFPAWFTGDRHA